MLNKLFSGKIGRLRYFGSLLVLAIISGAIILGSAMVVNSLTVETIPTWVAMSLSLIALLFIFTVTIVTYSIYAKRCHDLNLSGWYSLLMVIPIFNFFFSLYLLFAPGKIEGNQY